MKHYMEKGLYETEMDVWDFYSVDEMIAHETECPNWKFCIRDAERYLGRLWHDDEVRYLLNGKPIYRNIYRIVGLEDNNAMADYYWILRPLNEDGDANDRHVLWGYDEFEKNIM